MEPVFYKGAKCGAVQKYSDLLLIFLLKARRPDMYRERWTGELSGPGGKPLHPEPVDLSRLSDEGVDTMAFLARKAAGEEEATEEENGNGSTEPNANS